MGAAPLEDGFHVIDADETTEHEAREAEDGVTHSDGSPHAELEDLRDAFVTGFNARYLDAILGIVRHDVDVPDVAGADGSEALSEELQAIWERSPEALLTRGFLDEVPVAVAWRPDEEGCWTRVALICFDHEEGLLSLVSVPDDADALDRTQCEEPEAELEQWNDWGEWDSGEETIAPDPGRARP